MALIAQLCLCLSGLSLSFGQDGAGWGQMIQWEDSGRRYRLLNSGQEYQPAGESAGGTRVLLDGSRGSGVDLRRQAPTLPRTGSQTVRGNTRHPFGFGQVPDNWRGGSETSSTLGRFGETASTSSRVVPSTGTGGGGGSRIRQTYSQNSVGPPFLPRPQPPFVAQPDFYPQGYEETYSYSRGGVGGGGGGGGGGGAGGGGAGGGGYVAQPPWGGAYEDFYEEPNPPYAQPPYFGVPPNLPPQQPAVANPVVPQDGLDRRYSHSLFRGSDIPAESDPVRPGVGTGAGEAAIPPYGGVSQGEGGYYGAQRPDVFQPQSRVASAPNSGSESQGGQQARVSAGTVFRGGQSGRGEFKHAFPDI